MVSELSEFYVLHSNWILPVLIFGARVLDVSIGTLRIVFLSRGMRLLAPLCGFFEVLIWLIAISRIMNNLTSWVNYAAYAGGFAAGNYVGMYIENKLAMGLQSVMVILKGDSGLLLEHLKKYDIGATQVDAHGSTGAVKIVFLIIKRKDLLHVTHILKRLHPDAFSIVNDVRNAAGGIFPVERIKIERRKKLFGGWRKDK